MATTRIASTAVAKSVVLTDQLTARGWTATRSQVRDPRRVSQTVRLAPPLGSAPVKIMIVTYPEDGAQLVEFTCEPSRGTGKWSTGAQFYWRLSVFDAPHTAILAAARVALTQEHGPVFDTAAQDGWETCLTRDANGHLAASTFVHPVGRVSATFHYPFTPGECGGWVIAAPTCHADATGHTPGPVIRALAESLFTR